MAFALLNPNPNVAASGKNFPTAVADLGLGDQLQTQVQDEIAQRKKKETDLTKMGGPQSIMSPAVMALLGNAAGGNNGGPI